MTKVAMWAGILVLVVACGSPAEGPKQSAPAPMEVVQAQGAGDLETLRQRVTELEARLDSLAEKSEENALVLWAEALAAESLAESVAVLNGLRWTEADAIAVVQEELREAVHDCGSGHSHSASTKYAFDGEVMVGSAEGCVGRGDYQAIPVLTAFLWLDRFPGFLLPTLGRIAVEEGVWSATHEPENLRWRVTVMHESSSSSLNFYVYERTGLVEGTGPTAEEMHNDAPREPGVQPAR